MHPQEGRYAQTPPMAKGFPVNQAPQPPFQVQTPHSPWTTGFCNCGDDVGNCFITCFCPCITFGQIAEIVDRGSTSCGASGALYTLICCVTGFQCLYSCFYRTRLRQQYGLPETPCIDCCVHCWCEACSLCQMYRELKRRGFDMSIGWHANMERQGQMNTAPPVYQEMRR